MNKPSVLAIVPARSGSKGVTRKNLRNLGGKPLLAHQIEAALAAESVERVVLTTDDEDIATVGREFGAEVPFRRPAELATDDVPVIAALKHAAEYCISEGQRPEYVVALQPTCPFTTGEDIDAAVDKAVSTGCDSVVSVAKLNDTDPYRAYRIDESNRLRPIEGITIEEPIQRQDRPDAYGLTGAIFLRRPKLLLDWEYDDFALGDDIRAIRHQGKKTIDIDTEFELKLARALVQYDAANDHC